jgi:hypothetical protein
LKLNRGKGNRADVWVKMEIRWVGKLSFAVSYGL